MPGYKRYPKKTTVQNEIEPHEKLETAAHNKVARQSVAQQRAQKAIAKSEERGKLRVEIFRLKTADINPLNNEQIAEKLDIPLSTVRALSLPSSKSGEVALKLLRLMEEGKWVDVSRYLAPVFGVSETTLTRGIKFLLGTFRDEFKIFYVPIKQKGTNLVVTTRVLVPADVTYSDLVTSANRKKIVKLDHDPGTMTTTKGRPSRRTISSTKVAGQTTPVVSTVSSLTLSIRQMKRKGLSNVAIGQRLGISESTVRRRLKLALSARETVVESQLFALEDAREKLLNDLVTMDTRLFDEVFGEGYGDDWIWQTHTTQRNATVSADRVTFNLQFHAYKKQL